MRYSLFILESELEQYVEYFAKVIIAKSPIDSIRSGSNKPDLSRMIWSRGDLVFALHHHFVNLTSRSYINTPLMIDLTQKLTVGWGITFPLNNKKINHKDYWDFFARFMAEEFYLKIAETHDNDSESSDDHSFQPICNGHIRLTQEEIKKYFSLTNNTNKTALLNKISSKKILKNTPAYYKFFDRYEDGKGLMEHLGENVRYIKETLSLCELVDKQSRDNSIYFNNIEIISDDKLFLIYIYYLYRYCEEKDHGKSGSSQSTEPQKSGDSQPTEPQNSDETKDNEVSFAPPQLIALPKYDPQKSNIEVNGFECIGNEELLSLHQIITIPTKKQADKKAKNELSEIVIATHAKEKIIAIQNALGLPHSKITETNRFQLEQVIRNLAATYLKVNAGLIIVLFVVLFGGGIGGTILIVGNFNQRTQEVEKLETKLANMTRIIDIPVSQKIQEYLIPDSSFRHQYFINANDPLLKSLVLNKKSELIDHEIDSKLFDFKLSRENKEIQPLYIFGSKKDSIDFKITQSKKLYKNMEFIWIVYKYINTPQNTPKISFMDIRFSKLREKNSFQINDSLTKEAVKIQKQPFSGTYVVLGMACPYNWHSENKLRFQDINERVQWRMKNGIADVIINTEGAVHVGGFMAFDIIDPSEN